MAKIGFKVQGSPRCRALRDMAPRCEARFKAKDLHQKLFNEAKKYIPGGVNSPVRSFKAVGGYPIFIKKAKGSKIYDESGKEFIDYCMGFGAMILGHAHPVIRKGLKDAIEKGTCFGTPTRLETELARLITEAIPSIKKLRLTNSGSEAVMGAIRLARAWTRRDIIIRFEGSYHGNIDFTKNTLVLPYNDIKKIVETVKREEKNIAAIIVEPVAGNMGVVLPRKNFLETLREVSDKYKIVLIFDEVITSFRLTYGSAQSFFKVKADLTCLGKIIGGGLPIGGFGGRKEVMGLLAPDGPVYQAGTFSGNPISVSAGLATLRFLRDQNPYKGLEERTRNFCEGIRNIAEENKIELKVNFIGSMFSIFFADSNLFKRFYSLLLKEGIYFSPSGLEANFLSLSHTNRDIEDTIRAISKVFGKLGRQ